MLKDPPTEAGDQTGFFGERNEVARRDKSFLGVIPAQKGLETADFIGFEVYDRLIREHQFVIADRLAQVELKPATGLQLLVHLRSKKLVGATSDRLGAVEGKVRELKDLTRCRSLSEKSDADTGSYDDLMPVNKIRGTKSSHDLRRKSSASVQVGDAHLKNGKLVATQARNDVTVRNTVANACCDFL